MSTLYTTSVFVIAPSTLVREAWSALIAAQPGLLVIGAALEPAHYAALAGGEPAQVVLLDAPATPERVILCRSVWPTTNVLALVDDYELPHIIDLLQAGVVGVFGRDEPVASLVRALIAAGRGELVLPAAIAAPALAVLSQGQRIGIPLQAPLTEREQEVLRMLAQSATNKNIAQTLFVSVRTVEAHMRSIFSKLGVRSRTEAALWAVRHGYGLPQ